MLSDESVSVPNNSESAVGRGMHLPGDVIIIKALVCVWISWCVWCQVTVDTKPPQRISSWEGLMIISHSFSFVFVIHWSVQQCGGSMVLNETCPDIYLCPDIKVNATSITVLSFEYYMVQEKGYLQFLSSGMSANSQYNGMDIGQ